MAGFVQIIEYSTARIEEVRVLSEKHRADRAAAGDEILVKRATAAADRDRPGTYLTILEFDSYESAMANSKRPETSEFAARMGELCDGPPKFYNLDVQELWQA